MVCKFVLMEVPRFRYISGYKYEVEIEIKRSMTQEKVYHIKHSATNWAGLQRPLVHTLFNDIYNWLLENDQSDHFIPLLNY